MASKPSSKRRTKKPCSFRFEAARIESLFEALDGVAWLQSPTTAQIAEFAGIDPRTAGKLLKNAVAIGLVEENGGSYALLLPYPHKGKTEQKRGVVREALVRLPYLVALRQFLRLGDDSDNSMRKAAVVQGIENFDPKCVAPLLQWAKALDAMDPTLDLETLVDAAEQEKERRHREEASERVVFLSHSSLDKVFIRRLATDLTASGVTVWLDEQRLRVGDSIPDGIAQGLAEADYFLIVISRHSVDSDWVKRELNAALVDEISRRQVKILPVRLDDTEVPKLIADKKYADFSKSYKSGLSDLLASLETDQES